MFIVYLYGWHTQSVSILGNEQPIVTKISVVVAARNEANNIERCVDSILSQKYPSHLFELIVVDDCSTDDTLAILNRMTSNQLQVISLNEHLKEGEEIISFKKKALTLGIEHSKAELIVTTDADCWMSPEWLSSIALFYQKEKPEMIVAPVRFSHDLSLLQLFQSLDFMTMQGITASTVGLRLGIMCNGANLAFSRKVFNETNGYDGVDHLISGDDYLLQYKILEQYPLGVRYLKSKDVIVNTLPQDTWRGFWQQRIRWASKTGKYKDVKTTLILLLIYFFNCTIFCVGVLSLFQSQFFNLFITLFLVKTLVELFFLFPVAKFFNDTKQLIFFPFLQPLHIVYIIVAGFLSRIGKFEWRQRLSIQR